MGFHRVFGPQESTKATRVVETQTDAVLQLYINVVMFFRGRVML